MNETDNTIRDDELSGYVDGELDRQRQAEVETYLAGDEAARERVAAWRRQRELIKTALDPIAAEAVPPAMLARMRRAGWRRHAWPSAAAASIAFAIGLGTGWLAFHQPATIERGLAIAETGLSAHRVYFSEVRHPVEVGSDEETHLVNWLSKRLDTPIKAPDLSEAGLRLLGGRLVPSDGEPGALLMYEGTDGERFTLFIARDPEARATAFRYVENGQLGAFYWVDRSVGYVLSGIGNRERLLRVARSVYEQLP